MSCLPPHARPQLRILSCVLVLLWASAGGARAAYEVVTRAGQVHEADSVQFAGTDCIVTQGELSARLPADDVDYYETFRRNAERGAGNVVVFRTGSLFRFESVALKDSQVSLQLGDDETVTVPEGVVDFEQSVREGAAVWLPRGRVHVDVARPAARSGARSSAIDRARAGRGVLPDSSPGRRARSAEGGRESRFAGRDGSRRTGASGPTSTVEPGSSSYRPESLSDDPFSGSDGEDGDRRGGIDTGDAGNDGDDDQSPSGRRSRDGMSDPEELRRRAEDDGQRTGMVTVIVASPDDKTVHGFQFRVRYPTNCQPTGALPIGAFANASMSQPNGRQGPQELGMIMVFAPGVPSASLPGNIAQLSFVWTGQEPTPAEFAVTHVAAADERGNVVRGVSATATMIQ